MLSMLTKNPAGVGLERMVKDQSNLNFFDGIGSKSDSNDRVGFLGFLQGGSLRSSEVEL